jgi:hypothetical protein
MTQCDDRGMLLRYPWPQKKGALAQTIEKALASVLEPDDGKN